MILIDVSEHLNNIVSFADVSIYSYNKKNIQLIKKFRPKKSKMDDRVNTQLSPGLYIIERIEQLITNFIFSFELNSQDRDSLFYWHS